MKGYNEDEVLDLASYAVEREIDISFIEEMPLGEASDHAREETTCSNTWVREKIAEKYQLVDSAEKTAGPSRYTKIANHKTRIGFISPVTHNFCEDCNRVRVTVEGRLLLCLGNEHSVDLRTILRNPDNGDDVLKQALIDSMQIKPERHFFYDKDHAQPIRLMNMTGG
jgi:cyclic pyranopterin phosphate synthase